MKKILFPATFRGHLARQKLLLDELKKDFNVHISEYTPSTGNMADVAVGISTFFLKEFTKVKPDLVLVRGDRYEVLPVAMLAAYEGIKIAHIEGGDLSGAIDNKVRFSITHLSDYHFCTNDESYSRLISIGISAKNLWNFGSLDVEFAKKVQPKKLKEKQYIFVAFHPIEGEDFEEVEKALRNFKDYDIVRVVSNVDYGKKYGSESYSPEDYVNMMRYASCCVGNSSSFLKEASILKVPVVNVGDRQIKRLKPKNVFDVTCQSDSIRLGIEYQLKRKFDTDYIYYQKDTSKNIAQKIKEILSYS